MSSASIRRFSLIFSFILTVAQGLDVPSMHAQPVLIIDSLSSAGFPEIRIKIRVMQNGTAVGGLTIANFVVFEDGRLQQPIAGYCIDSVGTDSLSVLLVIDKSNSMGPMFPFDNAIADAKIAAKNFISRLLPSDEFALLTFNDNWTEDQLWTTNKPLMNARIDAITTSRGTALWDALVHAADMMSSRTRKRVMIVLTDGQDQNSFRSFEMALSAVLRENITTFTIGLGNSLDTSKLKQLATFTHGRYYNAPTSSDLDQIYASISQQFLPTGLCEIRYTSLLDCLDGSERNVEIRVNVNGSEARGNATFRLPYDTTSFSYVRLSMNRDYVVEAGATVEIPINLEQVSAARPSAHYSFNIGYDPSLVELDSLLRTPLTQGYTVDVVKSLSGASVTLSGATPLTTTGELLHAVFHARDVANSGKTEIAVSPPEAGTTCTIASSRNGLITVSGRCERALSPDSKRSFVGSRLGDSRPNPFSPGTWIGFALTAPDVIALDVFDMLGRKVATILHGPTEAGDHRVYFDARDLAPGWYMVRLTASDRTTYRRVLRVN